MKQEEEEMEEMKEIKKEEEKEKEKQEEEVTLGRSMSLLRSTSLSFANKTECSSLAMGLSWKLPTYTRDT